MKKCIILILVNCIFSYPFVLMANFYFPELDSLSHQVRALEKGDQVPDLEFTSLVNANKNSLKLSDFKGKLVILDFWATWCSSCVAELPKLNELQKKFKDKIQVIGITDQKFELIEKFYQQRREKQNLDLVYPTATNDVVLTNYFPHQTVSHLVWINEYGKVMAITESGELNEEIISKILNKKSVNLKPKTDRRIRKDINTDEPLFLNKIANPIYINEGVTDGGIRYKTIITRKVEGLPSSIETPTGRVLATNVIIENLFQNAYKFDNLPSGEYLTAYPSNKLRWEVGENNLYNVPKDSLQKLEYYANNLYCFEIVFPDYYEGPSYNSSKMELNNVISNVMKRELHNWTGFYSAIIPKKESCLVLSLIDSSKIVSKDVYEKSESIAGNLGITFKNSTMLDLKKAMWYYLQLEDPLIDETDYFGHINMRLDCKLTDLKKLQEELLKFGLKLTKEKRNIPVLIVRNDLDF